MTTQRRTTRITTNTATPATLFAAPTASTLPTKPAATAKRTRPTKSARPTTKRPKPPYEPAALYPAYSCATKELLGYGCPSRSGTQMYCVTRDEYGWHCTCDARVPCCHIEAVEEMEEIKAASASATVEEGAKGRIVIADPVPLGAATMTLTPSQVATCDTRDRQIADARAAAQRRSIAPLNGNKAFSLFR